MKSRISFWENMLTAAPERLPGVFMALADLEDRMNAKRLAAMPAPQPIYVAGLARSGTTALIHMLGRHSQVGTHIAPDFPGIFTPLFWSRLLPRIARLDAPPAERIHGDGIEVDASSPDAVEEVLWRAARGQFDAAFGQMLANHQKKILLVRHRARYAAKANGHLGRLKVVLRLMPNARIIIPVRHPVPHVASLIRQHANFCAIQQADRRARKAMRRLGHFEFGLDRQPGFCGGAKTASRVATAFADGDDVTAYALQWQGAYEAVMHARETDAALKAATLIVRHEDITRDPHAILAQVLSFAGLPATPEFIAAESVRMQGRRPTAPPPGENEKARINAITAKTRALFDYADSA